jgi:hypothetical protein
MRLLRPIYIIAIFICLTVLTQTGGLVYLLSLTAHRFINRRFDKRIQRVTLKIASFLVLYSIATFLIIPPIARQFNRAPLPLIKENNLRPLHVITCFLNRHYVRPELKQAAEEVARQMSNKFPGTVVNYLDGSFPFGSHFPLLPHLSHHDGKKLDIAFCYVDSGTGKQTNEAPSIIGYGICEEPGAGEVNTAAECERKGYWQYSVLMNIVPQGSKEDFIFDVLRTTALIKLFAARPVIGKLFIEPHLKERLGLTNPKIRFQGCQAVRHDDHLHVQVN